MNNLALLRSLIIYAICVPLAVFVGYQLTDPLTRSTFVVVGLLFLLLLAPFLLRWHHFFLVASWNVAAVMFFLPGAPYLWLPLVGVSIGVSILQRTLNKEMRFINVPLLTWPLILLAAVILFTAEMTGGIGIRALGSQVYGGKRYIYILGAILGYFALSAHRIPPQRAGRYVTVFLLGGLTAMIGDLFSLAGESLTFIFWIFPPNLVPLREGFFEIGYSRMGGTGTAGLFGCLFMLARFGIRGLLDLKHPGRLVTVCGFIGMGLLGGYRGILIILCFVVFAQFFLEKLHKTSLLPAVTLSGLLVAAAVVALAPKMPYMVQRTLAVFPIPDLDNRVRMDAQGTIEWRLKMWQAVLPEVWDHLWMGKGYSLSVKDFALTTHTHGAAAENWDSAVATDYHNGPLSVMIPFGIWGGIAFVWFIAAALRVLYLNYRFGDTNLKTYNVLLFAAFISRTLVFFTIGGGIQSDMAVFAGLVGLSVALNGGVRRSAPVVASEAEQAEIATGLLQRPAFQR